MKLDKHRESLAKYCFDLSKVTLAVAVLNPLVTKSSAFVELAAGFVVGVIFLLLGILLEEGGPP